MQKKVKLILTAGNPNGIGPEILAKSLSKLPVALLRQFIVVGEKESISHYFNKQLLTNCDFHYVSAKLHHNNSQYKFQPGEANFESGIISYLFLETAIKLIKKYNIPGLVTAPISKELIAKSGIDELKNFKGHTDFLAENFDIEKYNMMFYSNDLTVILATIHEPLHKVPNMLNKKLLDIAINNAINYCKRHCTSNNTASNHIIAVAGLNPHAGENGLLGSEEINIINPVIEHFKKEGVNIVGPIPGDTVFYRALQGEFDVVIAMYHDQGLAPFKLIHFMDGVNVTLGLPFIRTSPDHGTAFGIAGQDIADETSMDNSIKFALDWKDKI